MSYLQIYQEKIYDLLNSTNKVELSLREHPVKGLDLCKLTVPYFVEYFVPCVLHLKLRTFMQLRLLESVPSCVLRVAWCVIRDMRRVFRVASCLFHTQFWVLKARPVLDALFHFSTSRCILHTAYSTFSLSSWRCQIIYTNVCAHNNCRYLAKRRSQFLMHTRIPFYFPLKQLKFFMNP